MKNTKKKFKNLDNKDKILYLLNAKHVKAKRLTNRSLQDYFVPSIRGILFIDDKKKGFATAEEAINFGKQLLESWKQA